MTNKELKEKSEELKKDEKREKTRDIFNFVFMTFLFAMCIYNVLTGEYIKAVLFLQMATMNIILNADNSRLRLERLKSENEFIQARLLIELSNSIIEIKKMLQEKKAENSERKKFNGIMFTKV